MQPNEFWSLSLTEFWWEFDIKLKSQKQLQNKTTNRTGFTEAEWEAARRKFREKENDTADWPSR